MVVSSVGAPSMPTISMLEPAGTLILAWPPLKAGHALPAATVLGAAVSVEGLCVTMWTRSPVFCEAPVTKLKESWLALKKQVELLAQVIVPTWSLFCPMTVHVVPPVFVILNSSLTAALFTVIVFSVAEPFTVVGPVYAGALVCLAWLAVRGFAAGTLKSPCSFTEPDTPFSL